MKRIAWSFLVASAFAAACSVSSTNNTITPGGGGSEAGAGEGGAAGDGGGDAISVAPGSFTPEVACNDTIDSIYADPGPLPAELGAIIKCAKDKDLTKEELTAAASNYQGKPFTSGAHVYRVLYRTERGDPAKTPGTSSALVYVPDAPRVAAGSGKLLPVIVSSHGTKGQGGACAPSKGTTDAYMNYPLVGAGFAVIAPDLAGYANFGAPNNPPSGYAGVADVGKSTLDGARALRKMFSQSVSDKVVILGHSQGGGTALGALALQDTYGAGGTVVGVVAYAPLWLSQASWAALGVLATSYPFNGSELVNSVAIWYLYTHGELHDGPGHGGDVFVAAKRDAVKSYVENACEPDLSALHALGTDIRDVYDQSFRDSLESAASFGTTCSDDVCQKWKDEMNADRPHFAGANAQIPILLPYGGADTTIPGNRMSCVLDRLNEDKAAYTLCYEPTANHGGIVNMRADYVNDWIASKALGEADPGACKEQFTPPACATPPPNEWP